MDLTIEEVAGLLNVSESTVQQWVLEGKIPAYRMNEDEDYFFSRPEIENWVITHKLDKTHGISPFLPSKEVDSVSISPSKAQLRHGNKQFSLLRAVHKGNVLHDVPGKTKEELIRNVMHKTAKSLNVDEEMITDLLLDRESLMPTTLNKGYAVPHTRETLMNLHHDSVIIVFPTVPIDYGALDGLPVHTLFFLFTSEDKRHLHLLAKIAHLSNQEQTSEFFRTKPSKEKVLAFLKEWESHVPKISR